MIKQSRLGHVDEFAAQAAFPLDPKERPHDHGLHKLRCPFLIVGGGFFLSHSQFTPIVVQNLMENGG